MVLIKRGIIIYIFFLIHSQSRIHVHILYYTLFFFSFFDQTCDLRQNSRGLKYYFLPLFNARCAAAALVGRRCRRCRSFSHPSRRPCHRLSHRLPRRLPRRHHHHLHRHHHLRHRRLPISAPDFRVPRVLSRGATERRDGTRSLALAAAQQRGVAQHGAR